MREKILESWKTDRLYTAMVGCWLITVVSAFLGLAMFPITVPALGTLYGFRFFLPITAVLYLWWAIKHKEPFWRGISLLEKWCYVFCILLLIYGALSLFRAIEFAWTFRKLFNLTYDLILFLLMIRLCRRPTVREMTMGVCAIMLGIQFALGLYEVFFGGIWNPGYDNFKRVFLFNGLFQFPVVTSGNTNNFSTIILFTFAALLMWKMKPQSKWTMVTRVWITVYGILAYFIPMISNGRLCSLGSIMVLFGLLVCFLCSKQRGKILIPLLIVCGLLFGEFANRYYYLMPQIQAYIQAVQAEREDGSLPSRPDTSPAQRPTIDLQKPNQQNLQDEFFSVDEKTGETVLRQDASGGVRTLLLLHAGRCFLESYGMGVGLGNTELLARDRQVIPDAAIWSIHCFLARLIADYGIFALIPLTVIVFLLLRTLFQGFWAALRKREQDQIGYLILVFMTLLIFPIVSTASSDAQDILPMWLYLGSVIIFVNIIKIEDVKGKELEPCPESSSPVH